MRQERGAKRRWGWMRKRQITIGVIVALLFTGATAYVAAGMRLYAQYQRLTSGTTPPVVT